MAVFAVINLALLVATCAVVLEMHFTISVTKAFLPLFMNIFFPRRLSASLSKNYISHLFYHFEADFFIIIIITISGLYSLHEPPIYCHVPAIPMESSPFYFSFPLRSPGIRTMQCILLKTALLFGVHVLPSVTYEGLIEPVPIGERSDTTYE